MKGNLLLMKGVLTEEQKLLYQIYAVAFTQESVMQKQLMWKYESYFIHVALLY